VIQIIQRQLKRTWLAFISLPVFPSPTRAWLIRKSGAKIGQHVRIESAVFFGGTNIEIRDHAFLNVGCLLDNSEHIFIGEAVRFGPRVQILTSTHDIRSSQIRLWPNDPTVAKAVRVEAGVWLGAGVIVLPGVCIAEGCVIGAGSVVTGNTERNGLYVGVPARRIKELPDDGSRPPQIQI
jgi:maltose O-acetyltransferase